MSIESVVAVLRDQRELIVSKFVVAVQKADFAPAGAPRSVLADHIPNFLEETAATLAEAAASARHASNAGPEEPSRKHAAQRWTLGYDVGSLIREYGLLRRCILEVIQERIGSLPASDFNALAEHLNAGIAQAVTSYIAYRDAQFEGQKAHLAFLAEAGELLSSSLDYRATLSRLASLIVPRMADWCAIHLDGVSVEEMTITHVDPNKVSLARELFRRYPLADSPRGYPHVMRTGVPLLVKEVDPDLVASIAKDPEQLALIQQIHAHSWMIVPLRVQGTTFGALTLAYSESERRYTEHDLVLAGDIARTAAVAIDNARLYKLSQDERSRVEVATRAKDEFVAMVSHELRTPLNAILGWLQLMHTASMTGEKRQHALEVIERNALAQSRLVTDLLDISRIITGKVRINPSQLELSNVVDMAVQGVAPAAEAKRIQIELEIDRDETLMRGDPDRLQQIFWNLLANAVKFTPKNGRVQVRVRRVDSDLEVTIEDNGVGISAEFMPLLFESFRQADAGAARSQGGLGLGLSIAKHLVELHGGSLAASSAGVGKGSSFTVRLPISPLVSTTLGVSHAPALRKSEDAGAPAPLGGVRVLIVDDDSDARELLAYLFEVAGMEVRPAGSAVEALGVLETFTPDVIVSDIGMPIDDGYSLIRSIRTLPSEKRNIPAIALTAFARSEDRTRALVEGFNRHLTKPVDAAALIKAIGELTQQRR